MYQMYANIPSYDGEITRHKMRRMKKKIQQLDKPAMISICLLIVEHFAKEGYKINVANPQAPPCTAIQGKNLILKLDLMDDVLLKKLYSFVKIALKS